LPKLYKAEGGEKMKTIILTGLMLLLTLAPITVFAKVDTSGEAFAQGVKDGARDREGLNGHGFDNSCPKSVPDKFCDDYKDGYNQGFFDAPDHNSAAASSSAAASGGSASASSSASSSSILSNNRIIINR
jgi:hypothetical protein